MSLEQPKSLFRNHYGDGRCFLPGGPCRMVYGSFVLFTQRDTDLCYFVSKSRAHHQRGHATWNDNIVLQG